MLEEYQKEKGVDNLIQEFLSIEENNFNLKIIGEGPLKTTYK